VGIINQQQRITQIIMRLIRIKIIRIKKERKNKTSDVLLVL